MKTQVTAALVGACTLFLNATTGIGPTSALAASYAQPDAHRLRTGRFTYRTLNHDRPVGKGATTIRQLEAGYYEISAEFVFFADFAGYPSQQWKTVATSRLDPISATLAVGAAHARTPVFNLQYDSGNVTGFFITRKNSDAAIGHSIDVPLPDHTYDQRIDWAIVLASDLRHKQRFIFNVFDPGTGISRVSVRVGSLERVHVPAGDFEAWRVTYRIEKAGGTEEYHLLVTRDLPRIVVREEFPDGSIDELVEMTDDVGAP